MASIAGVGLLSDVSILAGGAFDSFFSVVSDLFLAATAVVLL